MVPGVLGRVMPCFKARPERGRICISNPSGIATRSPVSTLVHFDVNVTNDGTPVPTASLDEAGVDPRAFAEDLLQRVAAEEASIRAARVKVRAKGEA